jgi:hypothetical protein
VEGGGVVGGASFVVDGCDGGGVGWRHLVMTGYYDNTLMECGDEQVVLAPTGS